MMVSGHDTENKGIDAEISMGNLIKQVLLDAKQKNPLSSVVAIGEQGVGGAPSLPGSFPKEPISAPWSLKAIVALTKIGMFFPIPYLKRVIEKLAVVEDSINSHQVLKFIAAQVPVLSPAGALAILGVLFTFAARKSPLLFSQLAGVAYPIFRSLIAIERPRINDDERWLTYWSCYGLFTLLDHQSALIQRQVKTYFLPKLLLLYWLSQDGSLVLYRRLVRPFLLQTKLLRDSSNDEQE